MGFSKNVSEKALFMTANKGVQPAMDWITAHMDDPDYEEPLMIVQTGPPGGGAGGASKPSKFAGMTKEEKQEAVKKM